MRYLGVFAELFGIRPWEWDHLDMEEVRLLSAYVDERNKQAKEG